MPRTGIRIISHLHVSNKQVFKHSLKIPGDIPRTKVSKEKPSHRSPCLDAIKERTLRFNERSSDFFDVYIKLSQHYFKIIIWLSRYDGKLLL